MSEGNIYWISSFTVDNLSLQKDKKYNNSFFNLKF